MQILELYAGIGGIATAIRGLGLSIACAVDIDCAAMHFYNANHPHRTRIAEIASMDLSPFAACVWWLSPPCLPYSQRGKQRDVGDSRAKSLLHVMDAFIRYQPPAVMVENVPPFGVSKAWEQFSSLASRANYRVFSRICCPTELGIPMRRKRFYSLILHPDYQPSIEGAKLAARFVRPWQPAIDRPLAEFLIPSPDLDELRISPALAKRFETAMNVVDPDDSAGLASCFTSSYGKAAIRSGSYVRLSGGGYRYFHPREIASLLGFPLDYELPPEHRSAYRFLGNSLSIDVVRALYFQSP